MNLCQFWDSLEPMNKIMMRALISWLWSCCIWRLTDKNQCYNLTSSNFSNEKNWFILVFGMRYGYVHLHYCFFLENKNIHWWHLCCRNVISVACTLLAGTLSFCRPIRCQHIASNWSLSFFMPEWKRMSGDSNKRQDQPLGNG